MIRGIKAHMRFVWDVEEAHRIAATDGHIGLARKVEGAFSELPQRCVFATRAFWEGDYILATTHQLARFCEAGVGLLPVGSVDENHAHGVRNLVTNPALISNIDE